MYHLTPQFDKDKSGKVSFKELFAGMGQVLGGDVEERAEFYFALYGVCARVSRHPHRAVSSSCAAAVDTWCGLTGQGSAVRRATWAACRHGRQRDHVA